jgi:hypothetical protein
MNLMGLGKNGSGTGTSITLISTADMSSNGGKGALDFELKWLKFLREAEEDYITRHIKVSCCSQLVLTLRV